MKEWFRHDDPVRTGIAFGQGVASGAGTGSAPLYRVLVPGAELRLLVLASDAEGCVGVDLDTGAFVRASHPAAGEPPEPFEIVAGSIVGALEPPDPARPEALELAEEPQRVGRMPARKADRLLAALHHPANLPLLGLTADAVPYWTLTGEAPSVTLVDLRADPRLHRGPAGLECHFHWQGAQHELMLADRRLLRAFERPGLAAPTRGEITRVLGYRPRRLLVMLTAPVDGYCHKAVAALLPGSGRG